MPERLLSYAAVALLLDCSDDTVRRLVKRGLLPAPERFQGLGPRFRERDVWAYLATAGGARQDEKVRRSKAQGDANRGPAEES